MLMVDTYPIRGQPARVHHRSIPYERMRRTVARLLPHLFRRYALGRLDSASLMIAAAQATDRAFALLVDGRGLSRPLAAWILYDLSFGALGFPEFASALTRPSGNLGPTKESATHGLRQEQPKQPPAEQPEQRKPRRNAG